MFGRNIRANDSDDLDRSPACSSSVYLERADRAWTGGDRSLAMHLYLAAFEKAQEAGDQPAPGFVEGLKRAWEEACDQKERALAAYVFEKLEPFQDEEESAENAKRLHELDGHDPEESPAPAPRESGDLAELISNHLSGLQALMDLPGSAAVAAFIPQAEGAASSARDGSAGDAAGDDAGAADGGIGVDYDSLTGYGRAIELMRPYGVGVKRDAAFERFVADMRARHGIDAMPRTDTILLRSESREDANEFMLATAGEIGQDAVRMYMDETPQGFPVLCVMTSPGFKRRPRAPRNGFEGPGVLMLEDIDLWEVPAVGDDVPEGMVPQLSRGAREAVAFIQMAVENPQVTVLATADADARPEGFFATLLGPVSAVDIDLPDAAERAQIWERQQEEHASLADLDAASLVAYTKGLSRSEIAEAARVAVEEAYRQSIARRAYVPVSKDNIIDKIAAFQPFDTPEYRALEDAAVLEFMRQIDEDSDSAPTEDGEEGSR